MKPRLYFDCSAIEQVPVYLLIFDLMLFIWFINYFYEFAKRLSSVWLSFTLELVSSKRCEKQLLHSGELELKHLCD